jgi:hypothetical protein
MERMKLFALPLLIIICWQARNWHLLQCPLIIVNGFYTPNSIYNWITKRASVRSAHMLSVE